MIGALALLNPLVVITGIPFFFAPTALLAQFGTPDPNWLLQFVLVAALTMSIGANVAQIMRTKQINRVNVENPVQRRDVAMVEIYRTTKDCKQIHDDLHANRSQFREEHQRQHATMEKSDDAQWKAINTHTADIGHIRQMIAEIPAETVRLIKEAREL